MRGIILAGGIGSRLGLTKVVNKHLLPVGGFWGDAGTVEGMRQCSEAVR